MINTTLTFDEEFESLYERLCADEFTNKFIKLSGLSLEKMDIGHMSHRYFTENWADENSVDHNANAHSIGPIHYAAEITKPLMKLEGLYLLHRYLRKDYGVAHADKLVTGIVMGDYYVHDSSGVGIQQGYSYLGSEIITVNIDNQIRNVSLKHLYELIGGVETFDTEVSTLTPSDISVYDSGKWVNVSHIMKKHNDKKMFEFRMSDGSHQTVTEDHPMITDGGDVLAKDVIIGEKLTTVHPYYKHSIREFADQYLTKNLGYLTGFIVGDGWTTRDHVYISQKKGSEAREHVEKLMTEMDIHFIETSSDENIIDISDIRLRKFIRACDLGHMSENRRMPSMWVNAPREFLIGLVAGLFDAEGSMSSPNRNIPQIRMTGRTALLQTRDILSVIGCVGTLSCAGPWNREGSFKSTKRLTSLVFKFPDGICEELTNESIKMRGMKPQSKTGSHAVDERGDVSVIKIKENPFDIEYVYDITTSSGTFTCNGIHSHNCWAWSTHWLLTNGIPMGQLKSAPPKRASSFIGQVAETCMELSQDFAGAIAPADMLVAYAYFAKKENLSEDEMVNHFQTFTHIVNRQFRSGQQSLFSNISVFDRSNLAALFGDMVYPDGSKIDVHYVEYVQDVFMEWFGKGAPNGEPYRFPIVTANFTTDGEGGIVDMDFLNTVSKHNTPKGVFNIHSAKTAKLASCCRLINDPARMREFNSDSFGNGGLNLGSARVVMINLPRIAYLADGNSDKFFALLFDRLSDVKDILLTHRNRILAKRIKQGFLKPFDVGLASLNKMFATIGFTGVPEMVEAMGMSIYEHDGIRFVQDVLTYMDGEAAAFSVDYGVAFNIEEVPGESATINLADKDKVMFTDGRVKVDLYSNQFVPLTDDVSLTKRIEIEGKLMSTVSGGAMTHINLDEKIENPEIMQKLIEYIIKKGVTHAAINYGFTVCDDADCGEVNTGLHDKCPECDGSVTHMTRVVGYFVPVESWTKTRQDVDFPNRTNYDVGEVV